MVSKRHPSVSIECVKRTTWARNITIMRFLFCEKGHKSSVTTLTERAFDVPVYGVLCAVVWHTRGTPCR